MKVYRVHCRRIVNRRLQVTPPLPAKSIRLRAFRRRRHMPVHTHRATGDCTNQATHPDLIAGAGGKKNVRRARPQLVDRAMIVGQRQQDVFARERYMPKWVAIAGLTIILALGAGLAGAQKYSKPSVLPAPYAPPAMPKVEPAPKFEPALSPPTASRPQPVEPPYSAAGETLFSAASPAAGAALPPVDVASPPEAPSFSDLCQAAPKPPWCGDAPTDKH